MCNIDIANKMSRFGDFPVLTASKGPNKPTVPASSATPPTKFVWASVAGTGKEKKTLAAAQAEEEAQKAKEEAVKAAAAAKVAEAVKAAEAAKAAKKLQEEAARKLFLERNPKEAEKLKKREEQDAADRNKFTRDNGFWTNRFPMNHDRALDIPPGVNKHAMEWILFALANFLEWEKNCNTVGELMAAFYKAFVPYILLEFEDRWGNNTAFLDWEQKTHPSPGQSSVSKKQRYEHIQEWVKHCEKTCKTPWLNPMWVFAKHVTFENCLWAMNERSQTFKTQDEDDTYQWGIIRVKGSGSLDDPIIWLQYGGMSTYKATRHNAKPPCLQKQRREQAEADQREAFYREDI